MEQQFKHIKQMEHILNQMNELMETLRTTHAVSYTHLTLPTKA